MGAFTGIADVVVVLELRQFVGVDVPGAMRMTSGARLAVARA